MRRERGLIVIIAYKLVKGGLWLVLAVALGIAMQMGIGDDFLGWATHLRHHAHAWSLFLADALVRVSTRRGLWTLLVALVADGSVTLLEGWALFHGRWWGPWLVVAATGSFLPFEVIALVRHPHPSRIVLLLLNALIVWYLARKALREHREHRERREHERDARNASPNEAAPQ
ncbi:MAG TPA: DUF2127 domain-containing protein [Polyangiaceae bacterium]